MALLAGFGGLQAGQAFPEAKYSKHSVYYSDMVSVNQHGVEIGVIISRLDDNSRTGAPPER